MGTGLGKLERKGEGELKVQNGGTSDDYPSFHSREDCLFVFFSNILMHQSSFSGIWEGLSCSFSYFTIYACLTSTLQMVVVIICCQPSCF